MGFSANSCEPETTIQFGTHSALAPLTLCLAGIDCLLIFLSIFFLLHHRKHPAIIASSLELCYALLFGAAIGVAQMTLVGLPIKFTLTLCQIRFFLGALCWSLILVAGSLKAIRIIRMSSARLAYGTSSVAVIMQFCLCGTFLVHIVVLYLRIVNYRNIEYTSTEMYREYSY